jgi:hypothetical protein
MGVRGVRGVRFEFIRGRHRFFAYKVKTHPAHPAHLLEFKKGSWSSGRLVYRHSL